MIRPDIAAISAKWIEELKLQDRIITVKYTANLSDPMGNPVYGLMTIQNLDEGRFLIEVQDPTTWPANGSLPLSDESITEGIVHELVHIRWIDLTAHNSSPVSIVQEERATWATAKALVRAKQPTTRAAIVRAMMAKQTAAKRRQTQGNAMDGNAYLATLKLIQAASSPEEKEKLLDAAIAQAEAEQSGGPASVPEPAAPPMSADAGDPNKEKDKPPMAMGDKPDMRSMAADVATIRAMKADAAAAKAEAVEALALLRPAAKLEIVRAMRADGIELTKAAEDLITGAPTLEVAKERAVAIRAMAPATPRRTNAKPPAGVADAHDTAGLTPHQLASYNRYMRTDKREKAAQFVEVCKRTNATRAAQAGKGK